MLLYRGLQRSLIKQMISVIQDAMKGWTTRVGLVLRRLVNYSLGYVCELISWPG